MAEGFKDFVALDVLTSAQVDDYLMRQTVMRFASAAARDSALSGVVVEGMVAYLKDVDQVTIYSGSAWVQMSGIGVWNTWTPTVVQGPAVTVSVGYASYQKLGRLVVGNFVATVTAGTGSAGAAIYVLAPPSPHNPAAAAQSAFIGVGAVTDNSAGKNYVGGLQVASSTLFQFFTNDVTSAVGVTPSFALGVNDILFGQFCYESTS